MQNKITCSKALVLHRIIAPLSSQNNLNRLGLACGLTLGQGSIFVALSILIAAHRIELVAAIGLAYSFSSLGLAIVDWGTTAALARRAAISEVNAVCPLEILVARAPGAIVISVLSVLLASEHVWQLDEFTRAFLPWGVASAFIWLFNTIGLLDGRRLAGVSGLLSSFPALLYSGVVCLAFARFSESDLGTVTGIGLIIGTITSVLCQFLVLRNYAGIKLICQQKALSRSLVIEGSWIFAAWIPGQLVARGQIIIVATLIGGLTSGYFVYARQVLNGLMQAVSILRRVELPALASKFTELSADPPRLRRLYMKQVVLGAGALFAITVVVVASASTLIPGSTANAARYVLILLPIMPIAAFAEGLSNLLLVERKSNVNALLQWLYLFSSLGLSWLLVPMSGVPGLVVATVIALLMRIAIGLIVLRRKRLS